MAWSSWCVRMRSTSWWCFFVVLVEYSVEQNSGSNLSRIKLARIRIKWINNAPGTHTHTIRCHYTIDPNMNYKQMSGLHLVYTRSVVLSFDSDNTVPNKKRKKMHRINYTVRDNAAIYLHFTWHLTDTFSTMRTALNEPANDVTHRGQSF